MATVGILAVLELSARFFVAIPNPPVIYLIAVVYAAFVGGIWTGLVSGALTLGYALYFFSVPGQLLHYTPDNIQRVMVLALGTPTIAIMVGILKQRAERAIAMQAQLDARKEAEASLRESEEKYRLIIENIGEVVYRVVDEKDLFQGTLQFVSAATENVLGYPPDDFLRDPGLWFRIIHPDDVPAVVESTQKILASREAGIREYRLHHKLTGEYHWMSDRVVPLLDDQGKLIGLQGVARDITERKRVEEALRESENRQAFLLRSVPITLYVAQPLGDFGATWISESVEHVTGFSCSQFIEDASFWQSRLHPEDRERVLMEAERILEAGSQDIEYRWQIADGSYHWFHDMAVLLRDQAGKPKEIVGSWLDITERKRAEAALQASEQRFRALIENSTDAIVLVAPDGTILYESLSTERILGYTSGERIGKQVFDHVHPDDAPMVKRLFGELVHKPDASIRTGFRYQHKNGAWIWLEGIGTNLLDDPAVRAIVANFRDITERKQAAKRFATLFAVTDVSAKALTLRDATPKLLEVICEGAGWELGEMWRVDRDANLLRCEGNWHLPSLNVSEYDEATRGLTFASGKGLPGRVWASGKSVWLTDLLADPDFPRASAAVKAGFRAAFAFPIFLVGGVTGVLVFFSRDIRPPDDEFVKMMADIGERIGEFIARKQTEESLLKLSSAAERSLDPILITNRAGIIEYVNPGFERLTGYTREEAIGKTPRILKSGKHVNQFFENLWATILAGKDFRAEFVNRKKNGELYYEERTITPLKDAYGDITHFVSTGKDVTEHKRTEQELRRRADEFAALYDSARALSAQQDLPALLQTIVERATELLDAPSGAMLLYDAARDDLEVQVIRNFPVALGTRLKLGEGLNGRVAQTRQPMIVNDYHTWEHRTPIVATIPFVSALAVPLLYGGELVGVLSLVHGELSRIFTEADTRLLSLFAAQAAAAVSNARLLEETRRRAEQLALVNQISGVINQLLALSDVLTNTLRELTRVLGVDRSAAALLSESHEHLTVIAGHGATIASPKIGSIIPLRDNRSMDYIFREGRPLAIVDAQNDPIMGSAASVMRNAGVQTILILPLIVQDQVIGTIGLDSVRRRRIFTEEEIALAQTITHQAAAAIERARLFEEEQTRRKELAALYDLSRDLADAAYDFDAILDLVTCHAVETVRVTFARVALLDGAEFVLRAAYPARVLERDLGVGRREAVVAHPFCRGVLEQNTPVVLRADSPDLTASERATLLLDFARTLCLVPLRTGERALGLLLLSEVRREEREPFTAEKIRLARNIGDQAASALRRAELFAQLEHSYLETVFALANAVDAKDTYTANHAQRLAQMAIAVGQALGMAQNDFAALRYGAVLHDIGKIGVPDAILKKPSKLDADEWKIMRQHPEIGAHILAPVSRLAGAAQIVRHHHERYDGKGYPDGLAGEAIPLGARILTVVDSYSAIIDKRVYKAARSNEEAIAELRKHAGTQFDPRVVEIFLQILERGLDITGGGRRPFFWPESISRG